MSQQFALNLAVCLSRSPSAFAGEDAAHATPPTDNQLVPRLYGKGHWSGGSFGRPSATVVVAVAGNSIADEPILPVTDAVASGHRNPPQNISQSVSGTATLSMAQDGSPMISRSTRSPPTPARLPSSDCAPVRFCNARQSPSDRHGGPPCNEVPSKAPTRADCNPGQGAGRCAYLSLHEAKDARPIDRDLH